MHFVPTVVAFVLVATLGAQAVRNVPTGADLTQVFAAAAPGDVMLLAPGTYQRFTLTKGLTVVGPAVIQAVPAGGAGSTTTVAVPASEQTCGERQSVRGAQPDEIRLCIEFQLEHLVPKAGTDQHCARRDRELARHAARDR